MGDEHLPAHRGRLGRARRTGTRSLFGNEYRGITRYWDVRPLTCSGRPSPSTGSLVFLIAIVTIALFSVFLRRPEDRPGDAGGVPGRDRCPDGRDRPQPDLHAHARA